jgi:CBS domain-containing protein
MPKISEVITRHVIVVRPDESVQRAAELMAQLDVGSLPVYDGSALVGIITDRDITVRATAFNKSAADTSVSEIMSAQTLSCTEDDSVEDVLKKMGDAQVRRLPVLNRAKEIVGIVSLGDLATRQPVQTGPALREISQHGNTQTELA